ncbi:MAG: hypothetical protein A3I05_08680 [Deltaproteobacteria bacterium RIFCSPLOWO2_02_FULL_44_10]|nr:MAG: hypothetical protein A3C46_02215 [Deltaproteobacteria bacterium RIFCSPHIGHO2_02_FULL_44_16]OGQ45771.1 MAG: hypothetical protein A3I05_08680 [Deltaproteobacteria bacterium RIFCSPLOWO2_02_FULL_44_10]
MGLELQDYRNELVHLLPKGLAWDFGKDAVFDKLLTAIANEFLRIGNRSQDLLNEADPRTTYEMLEDWERMAGLPDQCTGLASTLQERRDRLVSKLVQRGNQSLQFFRNLGLLLGYNLQIEEYDQFHVGDPVGGPLYGVEWMHAFGMIAPLQTIRPFRVNSHTVGERLVEFGDDVLECVINKAKPSHSVALFLYH